MILVALMGILKVLSGLIAARMTYLCEKFKIRKRADGIIWIEMASRSVTALDQLNHIIDVTFSNIEQFERFERYTILQSLYTAPDHRVEDGLMRQQECDSMRFIVGKSWDLKLQIHLLEKGCRQLADVIAYVILLMLDLYLEDVIPKSLFVCVCTQLYDATIGKVR